MKTTKMTAAITLVIAATLAMAACTPTAPTEPTSTPTSSPTATPTPTPTVAAAPTQEPIPAPTSQQEVITSASKVIEEYLAASFELGENPELGVDFLDGYILPGSRQETLNFDTVTRNLEKGWRQVGTPSTWRTNDAMSYASQSTNAATGETNEFGAAIIYGCGDNSGLVMEVPAGQEAPNIPRGPFPGQWTLVYEQSQQIWLIQDSMSLTGQEGAPTC